MADDANDDAQNFHKLCDEMLEYIKHLPLFEKFDPFCFDVNDEGFKVIKGKIRGISSIHRYGNVCVITNQDESLRGSVSFQLEKLNYAGKHKVKCLGIWFKGEAKVSLSEMKIKIEFTVINGSVSIEAVRIIDIGHYKIKDLSGFSPVFNGLAKQILNITVHVLETSIVERMEKELREYANEAITKLIPLAKL